tara:strand:- start:3407 stop:3700 length:294 start_codon:yes stop_codon:yes gene_type:complete
MSLVNHFKLIGHYIKNITNNPKENLSNIKNVSTHIIKHIWSNSPKSIFLKTGQEMIGQKEETNMVGGKYNKKTNKKKYKMNKKNKTIKKNKKNKKHK